MDTIKIGKFIAECRKKQNLTQNDLAQKLNITDRAVSKWERGKSLPDASIMLELCELLDINVNELLTGEKIEMTNYNEQAETNLIEMKKQKEESDKRLLFMEVVIGILGCIFLFVLIPIAALVEMALWIRVGLIIFGAVIFLIACLFAIRIEQKAGYYECKYCKNKFTPTFSQVFFAPHFGRSRKLKCPKCGERSYCKKIV